MLAERAPLAASTTAAVSIFSELKLPSMLLLEESKTCMSLDFSIQISAHLRLLWRAIEGINWASSGGGGETRSQEHLCGAVANGGGGENGGQEPLRGSIVGGRPAQSVDTAAGDAMRVVVAPACAVGVIPSAHKRKRGRPKGSKNKQKPTSDGEPTCKRGCPAGSKASPKRSLAQVMDHFQDNVPPVKQPALTPSQSLPGETSAASASVMHSVPIEASVPPSRSAAVQHSASPSTSSAGTPRKSSTRPPLIPAMYVDTLVAFAPEKEGWTKRQKTKHYVDFPELSILPERYYGAAISSAIRQCVLEVVRPLYGTSRIVNSDNYYTSVQLLDALRLKGLYGRGTVRKSSAHFSRHVVLEKKDCPRGTSRQSVSADRNTVAASWYDSSIVTVISNADASTLTTVDRQVRSEKQSFSAPTCIREYNANMQGVDRLDQVRGRFSLADGHYFKKLYKKLGLALVDIARPNAYFTRKLALGLNTDRDAHREVIVQLSSELLSGKWKEAPSERRIFYNDVGPSDVSAEVDEEMSPLSAVWVAGRRNADGALE
ncbi:hypothetical protein PC128_g13909 [Phytophthora cactorum]|nr:hypothetical protein PC128_g13909 [Phytophthora cactorum]